MHEFMEGLATYVGVKLAAVISGTFGAAVSMAVIKGPIWYRLTLFAGGLVAAAFVTPLIVNTFDLGKSENAVAFLVGMFGMSIASAVIRTVQEVNFDSLSAQLRAWFGRN